MNKKNTVFEKLDFKAAYCLKSFSLYSNVTLRQILCHCLNSYKTEILSLGVGIPRNTLSRVEEPHASGEDLFLGLQLRKYRAAVFWQ